MDGNQRGGCDESSVPELTHEVIDRWHELMGDTIEAMHDGVQPRDERGRELAARFERLGGMPSALTGLKRLANQRTQGPKKYGRDFYAASNAERSASSKTRSKRCTSSPDARPTHTCRSTSYFCQ